MIFKSAVSYGIFGGASPQQRANLWVSRGLRPVLYTGIVINGKVTVAFTGAAPAVALLGAGAEISFAPQGSATVTFTADSRRLSGV